MRKTKYHCRHCSGVQHANSGAYKLKCPACGKDAHRVTKTESRILTLIHNGQRTGDLVNLRTLSRKVRVRQVDLYSVCEDLEININVGVRVGSGVHVEKLIGDYTLEDLTFDIYELRKA